MSYLYRRPVKTLKMQQCTIALVHVTYSGYITIYINGIPHDSTFLIIHNVLYLEYKPQNDAGTWFKFKKKKKKVYSWHYRVSWLDWNHPFRCHELWTPYRTKLLNSRWQCYSMHWKAWNQHCSHRRSSFLNGFCSPSLKKGGVVHFIGE